nr:hypothetical protein [Candidatus Freyrarchaeum guaymaensis]
MLPAFSFILLHSRMGAEREYLSDDFWRKWSSWLKPPKERGYNREGCYEVSRRELRFIKVAQQG